MTTDQHIQQPSQPVYRLGFAPYDGTDRNGQRKLGYPIEIGAAFQRHEADKGLVAKFRIIPANMTDGVLLLLPPKPAAQNGELDV
ncbi:hypothetical protein [Parvularcula marina]|uniref:Uncharacterized protein n=1 Tax=Parvularcula marina TaxID=2292771 RepID=A0A371RL79_9PROT|nr:hypothetical protein [Parvularcula marina]RFB06219.1 hypothetical protein DX908_13655 [Parvularcula marina]